MKLLIAALVALPVAAQSADLSLRLIGSIAGAPSATRAAVGSTIEYRIDFPQPTSGTVDIDVPGTVLSVSSGPTVDCEGTKPIRCTFESDPDFLGSIVITSRLDQPGTHTATARISGPLPDPAPSNNVATLTTEVVALPSLFVGFARLPLPLSPREATSVDVEVRNFSDVAATNVVIKAFVPEGGTITAGIPQTGTGVTCSVEANVLTCNVPRITRQTPVIIEVRLIAPDRGDGTPLRIAASAFGEQQDVEPLDNERTVFVRMNRQMLVTNTNDSGPGSLRQAIVDANLFCPRRSPCSIGFRIPAPAGHAGRFVIQPLTPLPVITGEIRVDGATQTRDIGNTNPNGPEIEINGALQAGGGAGLRLAPNCVGEVYDLAVTGFLGHGIDVSRLPGDPAPEACDTLGLAINAVIARNHLTGNMRGLGLRVVRATVEDNVMSNNVRSGLFVNEGFYANIRNNRIDANGASGIFLDMGDPYAGTPGGADITGNVITNNEHWGIARTERGQIDVTKNSIFGNVYQAIDINLDFDTPRNRPVLYWAIYDASRNATVVRGRLDTTAPARARFYLEVYASNALSRANQPQAERSVLVHELPNGNTDFELVIGEDLRGKWITATSTPRFSAGFSHPSDLPGNTSELSNAVYVAP